MRGAEHVLNTTVHQNRAKGPPHQVVAELKAGVERVGFTVALESVITKCVHRYAATHEYGMCRENLHAQVVSQESMIIAPV